MRTLLLAAAATVLAGTATLAQAQSWDQNDPGYDESYDDQGYYGQGYGPDGSDWVQPGDLFGYRDVRSVDDFTAPLGRYGRWVDSRWGRAFQPAVGRDWRPYVNGHWASDRFWVSDDPWGWATDHYGRWGYDDRVGWVWVPGTEWGPSWVAWRDADEVSGWAPIPPAVSVSAAYGWGWNDWYAPSWVWVPRSYATYPAPIRSHVLPWNNGRSWWRGSRWTAWPDWRRNPGWVGRPGWNGNWNGPPDWNGRPGWNGRPAGNGRPVRPPTVSEGIGGAIAANRPGWNGGTGGWNGQRPGWNGQRPAWNGTNGWNGQRPVRPDRPAGGWNGGNPGGGVGGGIGGAIAAPQGSWGGRPGGIAAAPPPRTSIAPPPVARAPAPMREVSAPSAGREGRIERPQ